MTDRREYVLAAAFVELKLVGLMNYAERSVCLLLSWQESFLRFCQITEGVFVRFCRFLLFISRVKGNSEAETDVNKWKKKEEASFLG